jgi:hypothetical protein
MTHVEYGQCIPSHQIQHSSQEEFQRFLDHVRSDAIAEATHRTKKELEEHIDRIIQDIQRGGYGMTWKVPIWINTTISVGDSYARAAGTTYVEFDERQLMAVKRLIGI